MPITVRILIIKAGLREIEFSGLAFLKGKEHA
jgi:hypothetical protein